MPPKQKPENRPQQTGERVKKFIAIVKNKISQTHEIKGKVFSLRPNLRTPSLIPGESRVSVRAGHLISAELLGISIFYKKFFSYNNFIEVQCAVYVSKELNNKKPRYVLSANTQRDYLGPGVDIFNHHLLKRTELSEKTTETETEILAAIQEGRVHLLDASAAAFVTGVNENALEGERMHAEIPFLGTMHQQKLKDYFSDLADMEMIKIIGAKRPCLSCTAAALMTNDARLVSSADGKSIHPGELYCSGDATAGLSHIITQYDFSPETFENKMQKCIKDQTLFLNRRHDGSAVTPPLSPRLVAKKRPSGAGAGTTASHDETVEPATEARLHSASPGHRGGRSGRGGQPLVSRERGWGRGRGR